MAVKAGQSSSAQALIEGGADLTVRDSDGFTVLHHAAANGMTGICGLLVDRGIPIDAKGQGWRHAIAAGRGKRAPGDCQISRAAWREPRSRRMTDRSRLSMSLRSPATTASPTISNWPRQRARIDSQRRNERWRSRPVTGCPRARSRPGTDGPKDLTTDELFKGKKVVLFSVPGAFTPTCDAKHLPGFVEKAADIKAKGVDTIACMAVNDAFVMKAWGKDRTSAARCYAGRRQRRVRQGAGPGDGRTGFGMGMRGQRFSLVVETASSSR